MNLPVKKFIETNIELIEQQMYTELYAEAYEWLTNDMSAELTETLTDVLQVDLKQVALEFIRDVVETELKNCQWSTITFDTLCNFCLNSLVGLSREEVIQYIVANPLQNTGYYMWHDTADIDLIFERDTK